MAIHPGEREEGEIPFHQALPPLIFLASVFFLNFLSRIIFSPLMPIIEKEMDFGHTVSGSLFLAISCGYFLSLFFAGCVSSRLTHRWTIVLSTGATGIALVGLANCPTLLSLRLGLFGLGAAAGLYLPSGLATITGLVARPYWSRGIAVHELAPNIGFVLAPIVAGTMVQALSWRQGLAAAGLLCIVMAGLYGWFGQGSPERGRPPEPRVLKVFLRQPQFWLMVLLFSLAICSTLGVFSMLPLLLVAERGMDGDAANRIVAISRLCAIAMPVPAGWLGDRIGSRRMMIAVLFLAGLATIPLGLFSGNLLLAAVIVQPMIAVCFFPSGLAALSGLGGRSGGAAVISLCIPLAFFLGGGAMPTLIGMIGDRFQLGAGFALAGLLMSIAAGIAALTMRAEQIRD